MIKYRFWIKEVDGCKLEDVRATECVVEARNIQSALKKVAPKLCLGQTGIITYFGEE